MHEIVSFESTTLGDLTDLIREYMSANNYNVVTISYEHSNEIYTALVVFVYSGTWSN